MLLITFKKFIFIEFFCVIVFPRRHVIVLFEVRCARDRNSVDSQKERKYLSGKIHWLFLRRASRNISPTQMIDGKKQSIVVVFFSFRSSIVRSWWYQIFLSVLFLDNVWMTVEKICRMTLTITLLCFRFNYDDEYEIFWISNRVKQTLCIVIS